MIERTIKSLKEKEFIKRIGSKKTGCWEVIVKQIKGEFVVTASVLDGHDAVAA